MIVLALLFAAAAPAQSAAVDAELSGVVDALYDLQLDSASAAISQFAKTHPGHPAAPFYGALVDYQRWIFYPTRSTETLASFQAGLDRAQLAAEAWVATSPAEGYYYIGAAQGFTGRALADDGHWFKAASPGIRGIKYLRRAIALDPSLIDADLGIGMYDYFRARMPFAAKPFAFLFTFELGNRERGLHELSLAAEKATLAKTEARSVLSTIYASDDEMQWDKAISLLAALTEKYPHSPLYRLRLAYAAARAGKWADALAADDPDGAWLNDLAPQLRDGAHSLATYRAVEAALFLGNYNKAAGWLDAAAQLNVGRPLEDWLALRRANLYDQQGQRDHAVAVYKRIKDADVKVLAKRFLKVPFPGGPKDVKPWTGLEAPR